MRNGRTHADYVNVVFVLRDVAEADGGFVSPLDHGAISSGSDSAPPVLMAGLYTRLSQGDAVTPRTRSLRGRQGFANPAPLIESGHLQHVALSAVIS